MKKSYEILNNPFLNKGTAFTEKERVKLGLIGSPSAYPDNWRTDLQTIP